MAKQSKMVDLTDGEINQVIGIDRKQVVKKYNSMRNCAIEQAGLAVFNQFNPGRGPRLLDQNKKDLTLEYLPGQLACDLIRNRRLARQALVNMIAATVGSTYWSLRFEIKKLKQDYPQLTIENRLKVMIDGLISGRVMFYKLLGPQSYRKLVGDIRLAQKQFANAPTTTLVHRDLQAGNVIYAQGKAYLIDYEHAMLAPIELEIANSIFWQDGYSLNVSGFRRVLQDEMRVPYDQQLESLAVSVYVADQLLLADQNQDEKKLGLIAKKYKKLIGKRLSK